MRDVENTQQIYPQLLEIVVKHDLVDQNEAVFLPRVLLFYENNDIVCFVDGSVYIECARFPLECVILNRISEHHATEEVGVFEVAITHHYDPLLYYSLFPLLNQRIQSRCNIFLKQ